MRPQGSTDVPQQMHSKTDLPLLYPQPVTSSMPDAQGPAGGIGWSPQAVSSSIELVVHICAGCIHSCNPLSKSWLQKCGTFPPATSKRCMSSQLGAKLQLCRHWLTAMLHQIMPSKAMLSPFNGGVCRPCMALMVRESISFLKAVEVVSAVSLLTLELAQDVGYIVC